MKWAIRLTLFVVVEAGSGCARVPPDAQLPLLSITRSRDNVAYIHLASAISSGGVAAWSVTDAKFEASSKACMSAMAEISKGPGANKSFARADPELSFGIVSTLDRNAWQVRTLSIPAGILDKDCNLTLAITSSDPREGLRTRQISIGLRAGFFQPGIYWISHSDIEGFSAAGIAEYFTDYQAFTLRIIVKSKEAGSFDVAWPQSADCSGGGTSLRWKQELLSTLPSAGRQSLAAGQWASAAAAFWQQPSAETAAEVGGCTALIDVDFLATRSGLHKKINLKVSLADAAKALSSELIWNGCPNCFAPKIESSATALEQ